jgi:hypothetical protein
MSDSEVDTSRTVVRTYVPSYQRAEWDAHAEELDMSRSEYVRSMVQAGRRGFLDDEDTGTTTPSEPVAEDDSTTTTGNLRSQVVDALSESEHLSWDELLAAVTDDIEDRLETTLQDLQADDRVRYSGPKGGYTLDE